MSIVFMDKSQQSEAQVSFEDEPLILVNDQDEIIGYKDKATCHVGEGVLHRAFSVFIFDEKGRVFMQKRSSQKRLWPLFWSSSCCSHPRKGEDMETATQRRLEEELGISAELKYLYKFQYQAAFDETGSEHELCYVYIGKSGQPFSVNRNEISSWEFMDVEKLDQLIEKNPGEFTPWFKMEWQRIRSEYWEEVRDLIEVV